MTNEAPPPPKWIATGGWRAMGIGLAGGLAVLAVSFGIAFAVSLLKHLPLTESASLLPFGFIATVTLLFPFTQGLGLGWSLGPQKFGAMAAGRLVCTLTALEILGAAVFLHEGTICLIIIAPLVLTIVGLGAWAGRWLARRTSSRSLKMSIIPLIIVLAIGDTTAGAPDHLSAVADSVVVRAPPAYVWRYIVQYPENTAPPRYWLWQIGLPNPIQSVADAPAVGARRLCKFSQGMAFEEEITELVPEKVMTFAVTKQPDHPEVTGHFRFVKGQLRLTDNGDGTTTVTATSWYHLYVRPAAYFDWWTQDITRHVHFRVMNHMKALAERDYAARPHALQPVSTALSDKPGS